MAFEVDFMLGLFFTIMLVEIDDAVELGCIVEVNIDIVVELELEDDLVFNG